MMLRVSEKMSQLGQRYYDHVQQLLGRQDIETAADKRMIKIQKKLAALEMEKCQRRLYHKDCSNVEEKIKHQKVLYDDCSRVKN